MKKRNISKMFKRMLATGLAFVMMVGALPATVLAEETAEAEETKIESAILYERASSDSEYSGNTGTTGDGIAKWAFDDNANTWWHSDWSKGTSEWATVDNPTYIQTGFGEATEITKVLYKSRSDGNNNGSCCGKDYFIHIANVEGEPTGDPGSAEVTDGDWIPVVSGQLQQQSASIPEQYIEFTEPVVATHIRITFTSAYSTTSGRTTDYVTAEKIEIYKVNKTALAGKIAEAEEVNTSLYTEASVEAFRNALTAAETINAGTGYTQSEINTATADLANAMTALELYVAVESVTLSQTSVELTAAGETVELTATVLPENATNPEVTWTSSNEAAATVENGVVTAVANGQTIITATTEDGVSGTCTVTVNIPVPVESVTLNQAEVTLTKAGETVELAATVLPENATNSEVTWTSSDEQVATVENGVVTAVADGEATITVASAENENLTATCKITVDIAKLTLTAVAEDENGSVTITLPDEKAANKLELFDAVTVTATANEGYEFAYWMDKDTKSIVSKELKYTFEMHADTNLVAVFEEANLNTVVFKTPAKFGSVEIARVTASEGDAIDFPDAPMYTDYKCVGWDLNGDGTADLTDGATVTGDMTIEAVYEVEAITYDVTVAGGTRYDRGYLVAGTTDTFPKDVKIAVVADKPGEGEYFVGWYDGDQLLTTAEEFWFFVKEDMALVAKYAAEEVTQTEPVLAFTTHTRTWNASANKDRISLRISWDAGESGTIVSEGFLRTFNADVATGENAATEFVLGTVGKGITTKAATQVAQCGVLTYNLNIGGTSQYIDAPLYVRGYVTYKDADNVLHTVYTDIETLNPTSK